MSLLHWFTRNWADTDEQPSIHPDVRSLDLPRSAPEALAQVELAIRSLPRWRVEQVDAAQHTIRATRRTRLWQFVDDVTIRLEPTPAGSRLHARSKSRLGVGDLGQNRRNLLELFQALR